MSAPFLLHTLLLSSLSLLFLLLSLQIDEVFIRCGLFTVISIMGLHLSCSIRRPMMRLKIEVLNDFKAGYSVSSVYVEGQSLLFFSHAPEKWGVRYPHSKKWGVCVPPVPSESYAYGTYDTLK